MEKVTDVEFAGRQLWRHGDDYFTAVSDRELFESQTGTGARFCPPIDEGLPKLIGLIGAIGAGKSTVGHMLQERRHGGHQHLSFATALKESVLRTLTPLGMQRKHVFGTQAEKAEPIPGLGGKCGRDVLVAVGTGGYRAAYENVWVDLALTQRKPWLRYVIDDVRFRNELRAVKAAGGFIWRVDVLGEELPPIEEAPPTEREWREWLPDAVLLAPRGDLGELTKQVRTLLGLPAALPETPLFGPTGVLGVEP